MSTGLVSTILIIAGFAFGTLLHELGDLMEKLLWSSKLLSPKTYASIRSGYAEHYLHRSDAARKAQAELESEDEPFTLRTALALILLGDYGAYTGGILHDIRGDILEDGAAKVIISMSIMLLLALRYYHYSYLKYKYSYEDLLAVEREQEAQAVQKPQESGPQRVAVELTVHRDRSEAVNL